MKKFLFLGVAGLLAAGFAGCKDDITMEGGSSIGDMDGETGYLSFRIKSANSGGITRAWLDETENGDYATGDDANGNFAGEDEIVNNVQANRAFFFYTEKTTTSTGDDQTSTTSTVKYHSSSFFSKLIILSCTLIFRPLFSTNFANAEFLIK